MQSAGCAIEPEAEVVGRNPLMLRKKGLELSEVFGKILAKPEIKTVSPQLPQT